MDSSLSGLWVYLAIPSGLQRFSGEVGLICVGLFRFTLLGTCCAWISVSFCRFGTFLAIIYSDACSVLFFLPLFGFQLCADCMLYVIPWVSRSPLVFSVWLSARSSDWGVSIILSSRPLNCSAFFILLFTASSSTFISRNEFTNFS